MPRFKPELSDRNPYKIEKHRYYELKHFCLQYHDWKKAVAEIDSMVSCSTDERVIQNELERPVERAVAEREWYIRRIELVERAGRETDALMGGWVVKAATDGLSFNQMKTKYRIPCEIDLWYKMYRRFFFLLDQNSRKLQGV